ncbi:glycosyltransferase [Limimaricola hongkongensis]|uniref:Glycosyl transferase, group 2 family protein n=1 Tax=Limimaricola hongkongensis DSM 17492 TaxID=1122180 RepID=A0A017HD77_9RHOB|nr:glycosyltransferase [Limimaricola hongkongensis]EYD72068.1 Glycosyl transferase, group 2 family protein [Limimaricola hongkongensis DSM 17492]
MNARVAVIAIGRNEGARLAACLASIAASGAHAVYVDSGSTDGSLGIARAAGARIVELDRTAPFTAARARNAGVAALREEGLPEFLQFVDGDCTLEPGWLDAGMAALDADRGIGIVTGWRREITPDATLYNAMAEWEWHRPAGDIAACGGDMMLRSALFESLGGFDGAIICSEDEDLCLRVRTRGLRVHRLPRIMTRHDIAMTRLGQWWRRAVRAGHGFAEVGDRHPGHFAGERRRVRLWGVALPGATLVAAGIWGLAPLLGAAALYGASWARAARNLRRGGQSHRRAIGLAGLLVLSKFPNAQGMLTYRLRRLRGGEMRLIEYR